MDEKGECVGRKYFAAAVGILFVIEAALGAVPGKAADHENPLFGYTHLLPSPFTLSAGTLVYGTHLAFGITDFLQVGTHLLRDIYGFYNANAKASLVDHEAFAMAATFGWESYNLQTIDATNPDLRVSSWQPGLIAAFELFPLFALFVGGNLNLTEVKLNASDVKTSGYARGLMFQSDISWAYNPKKDRIGNVLSAGVSFDSTYEILGFGVSHHWPGFHIGIHYYPNATQYRVQPILVGGGSVSL